MSDEVGVSPLTPVAMPSVDAALFLHRSPVGAHVGVAYRASDKGNVKLLHQAWHYDSRNEDAASYLAGFEHPVWWVQPGLDEDELADLCAHAELVGRRLRDGALPYAFDPKNSSVGDDGAVALGDSLGLTCATFVLRVFDAARVELLLTESWNTARSSTRLADDERAQRKLVAYLRREAPEHAAKVEREVGCTRIRAEEVAAASGMESRPVSFVDAALEGARLLAIVSPTTTEQPPTQPRPRSFRL